MLYWVFDLDYTLYSLPKTQEFSYQSLQVNKKVNTLLKYFPLKKHIFTNGTLLHAANTLKILEMNNIFHTIEARDTLGGLKPQPEIYRNFIQKTNIQPTDIVVFFEDTLENLKIAKEIFNWKTVFIYKVLCPDYVKPPYVDFVFSSIEDALVYFYTKFEINKIYK